jgi:hypothetical protein
MVIGAIMQVPIGGSQKQKNKTKESALIMYNHGSHKIEKIKSNNCI